MSPQRPTPASPPPTAASKFPEDFERQGMVRWFRPSAFLRTGVDAFLSALFGSYADKREAMAAVPIDAPPRAEAQPDGEYWFDYVADTGDGFDSTYSIAYAVTRPYGANAMPTEGTAAGQPLKRSAAVFLGGDEVYPAGGPEEYWNRFRGPYAAALPHLTGGTAARADLYAIPGNHDWYDGLTAFMRLFCQRRTLGAWQTSQQRSYFAVALPHDWWVFGIDIQLESYIDDPQLKYFGDIAETKMTKGSKVILMTAQPTWVYLGTQDRNVHRNLEFFESRVIRKHGHRLALGISGDLHCYARYEATDEGAAPGTRPTPWVMAGGGGAALHPPHGLPSQTACDIERKKRTWKLKPLDDNAAKPAAIYPPAATSKGLRWRAFGLPFFNPGFASVLGGVYLFLTCLLAGSITGGRLEALAGGPLSRDLLSAAANAALGAPALLLVLAALAFGLVRFADFPAVRSNEGAPPSSSDKGKSRAMKLIFGLTHTGVHLAIWLVTTWAAVYASRTLLNLGDTGFGHLGRVLVEGAGIVFIGGVLGSIWLGAYFFLANLFGGHPGEVLVCSSIKDYKQFLRFRIDKSGALSMYTIGIDRACRTWTPPKGLADTDPRIRPAGGWTVAEQVRLIEGPIPIP